MKGTVIMTDGELAVLAVKAMENSYSPYSGFKVGAALESKSGKVFTGCNVGVHTYLLCRKSRFI